MSLRTMHIVFIVASTALTGGFGAWCYEAFRASDDGRFLAATVASAIAVAALLYYGVLFIRRIGRREAQ